MFIAIALLAVANTLLAVNAIIDKFRITELKERLRRLEILWRENEN